MTTRIAMRAGAVCFAILAPALPVAAQVSMVKKGAWGTAGQRDGQLLRYGATDDTYVTWMSARCNRNGITLTAILPNKNYDQAFAYVGRPASIAFEFGGVRFVYNGKAYDTAEGTVEVGMNARLDDPLFMMMRRGGKMRIKGPIGAVDLPLQGAAPVVDAWAGVCNGRQ